MSSPSDAELLRGMLQYELLKEWVDSDEDFPHPTTWPPFVQERFKFMGNRSSADRWKLFSFFFRNGMRPQRAAYWVGWTYGRSPANPDSVRTRKDIAHMRSVAEGPRRAKAHWALLYAREVPEMGPFERDGKTTAGWSVDPGQPLDVYLSWARN